MFPVFRERTREGLSRAVDRAVELATLGEYRYLPEGAPTSFPNARTPVSATATAPDVVRVTPPRFRVRGGAVPPPPQECIVAPDP